MSTIYTITRLRSHLSQITDLVVRIGGRYLILPDTKGLALVREPENVAAIVSGDERVATPKLAGVKDGDLVVITCRLEDVSSWVQANGQRDGLLVRSLSNRPIEVLDFEVVYTNKNAEQTGISEKVDFGYGSGLTWGSSQEVRLWSRFLAAVRHFFHQTGFTEVTTPSLVPNPGMEPELEPFATVWRTGSSEKKLFLPTSPELHMKKLLAKGHFDIFEIKTVFRNEMVTDVHKPEFLMLEWYRGFASLELIQSDLLELLNLLGPLFSEYFKDSSSAQYRFGGLETFTVAQLFQMHLQFELKANTSQPEILQLAHDLDLSCGKDWSWNDIFHLIWVHTIEPKLSKNPFILNKYPPSQAALAKIDKKGWADRFEFYWGGVEIANAFDELTDPEVQRKRFEKDQRQRLDYGRTPLDIDEEFLESLDSGIPPTGGIALGLERLFAQFMSQNR